jgi:hypothetical protein
LASFRKVLKGLFNDKKAKSTDFFVLTVAKDVGGQKFTIDPDTTEDQWRKHVFDYLHSNSLIATRDGNITAGKLYLAISLLCPFLAILMQTKILIQQRPGVLKNRILSPIGLLQLPFQTDLVLVHVLLHPYTSHQRQVVTSHLTLRALRAIFKQPKVILPIIQVHQTHQAH